MTRVYAATVINGRVQCEIRDIPRGHAIDFGDGQRRYAPSQPWAWEALDSDGAPLGGPSSIIHHSGGCGPGAACSACHATARQWWTPPPPAPQMPLFGAP